MASISRIRQSVPIGLVGADGQRSFFLGQSVMSHSTSRILACLALALASFAVVDRAGANVGDMSGGSLSLFGRSSPAQSVQYGGDDCWYDNGWNGPGYYPCGNEWNNGLGGAGAVGPIVGPAIHRHHRHGIVVAHPQPPNLIYPGAPSRRLGVGVPSGHFHGGAGAPAFGVSPGWRRLGAAGVRTSPNLRPGAGAVTPGFAGGGFHGGFGGGNFHQFHPAGVPRIGAPAFPGFTGGGGLHGLGGAGSFHGAGIGVSHIGAPASPGLAGVGTFHAGGIGAPHIGAPASPGFAGGGFHGVGGAGAFQGGGAGFGPGGIGHR